MESQKIKTLSSAELEALHADMDEPHRSLYKAMAIKENKTIAQIVELTLQKCDPDPQKNGLSQAFLKQQSNNENEVTLPRFSRKVVH